MFISMNWISDFVDLTGLDKDALISKFSLSTAEVENEIAYKGREIRGVVAAEIMEVREHPDSKKLHLLKVDSGEKEWVDVVCGAPNVRVGMKTAFARVGAQIGEVKIQPREVCGVLSCGMCCSEAELGISDNNSGIMEIREPLQNGTDLKSVYEIEDIIFEVDNKSLTNRPDLWGHYGMAREFATLAGRPLREPDRADLSRYDQLPGIDMKIEDAFCQRYSCIKIDHITKHESPVNMRIRLYYCGMRSINLLADLTNYIMLEMGQPMHAFDSRKVGRIRIRRFEKPFVFQTLDGVEREIDPETLMICNDKEPVAIAGIMGGLDSEILEDTTALTLESATFDSAAIRKASVRLSHRTDASARYEKSLDPELCPDAIARFLYLLLDIDGDVQVISSLTDEYRYHYPPVRLEFDKAYVDKYTGIDIAAETIVNTLESLGFAVTHADGNFTVEVPSWRATKDVTRKADIIEEITRIYGYDNFDVFTASSPLYPIRIPTEKNVEDRIKDILVKRFGLHELHSYVWAYHDEYQKLNIEVEDNIRLLHATNPNIETIRRSIVPTQFCQIHSNLGFDDEFGIFEIGRVVDGVDENNLCREEKKLAITLYSRNRDVQTGYYALRDILANLAGEIKHQTVQFRKKEASHSYQHPKNLNVVFCDGVEIGEIGIAHPGVAGRIDPKASIVYAEIDVRRFADIDDQGIHYVEPSKYPSIEVDLSFVAQRFSLIRAVIDNINSPLVQKVDVIDVYETAKEKSITVRMVFGHHERTLTREEVAQVTDRIIAELEDQGIHLKD